VSAVLWLLALVLIVIGVVGTVLPALPGPVLVFAGLLLGAWADGFDRVGFGTITLLVLMTGAAYLVDLAAMVLGVQRSGASRRAVAGAAIGLLLGLPFGLPGLLIGPFIGAVLAELTVRSDMRQAGRAGFAAWIGFLVGTIAKLALVFAMIGIFAAALFLF
jgi:hypothetical protein